MCWNVGFFSSPKKEPHRTNQGRGPDIQPTHALETFFKDVCVWLVQPMCGFHPQTGFQAPGITAQASTWDPWWHATGSIPPTQLVSATRGHAIAHTACLPHQETQVEGRVDRGPVNTAATAQSRALVVDRELWLHRQETPFSMLLGTTTASESGNVNNSKKL